MLLFCPLCGETLTREKHSMLCPRGHRFDIARQGYVNLLPVQNKRSKNPGDTKEQVLARRAFLEAGFYTPIVQTLCDLARDCRGPILDVGCGEGYYSTRLAEAMAAELVGLDISKEAVRFAAGRYKNALWLCASAARLPLASAQFGLVTSLFSLTVPEEFSRVLTGDGTYIQVIAAPDHLLGLKNIIYDGLIRKEKVLTPELPGFRLAESLPLRFSFTAEGPQVGNLLSMTPHQYRISKEGARRLAETEILTDTASCIFNVYHRENRDPSK